MERLSGALVAAYTTKATCLLIVYFQSNASMSNLRADIQREVRWLRKLGISEKDALHPLLVQKVAKVMAMRGV